MVTSMPYIDLAQIVLYLFWIFFAGVVYYLLRENKREGYPLESDRSARIKVQGWPGMPKPKTYKLTHGGEFSAPNGQRDTRAIAAEPVARHPGAPLEPTGNPMLDGVGPGAYAMRADVPERMLGGQPKIVPLRVAADFHVDSRDPDPRGMPVIGGDGRAGGTVRDAWVDRSESLIRYLEVEVPGGARRLLPMNFCKVGRRQVEVHAIFGSQFTGVPALRHPDQVTLLEEDKICGYYGGGTLYAEPARAEPLL
ncbi:MAG: photosynthetic reaction center subunit H [Burkholderiales bacterium]|nr:photosynthetic reaction center subunit H [Burkholderiales bacterium]MDE2275840.1 photosynthetic reaction center subunit H [Burkholderiales bacterium]